MIRAKNTSNLKLLGLKGLRKGNGGGGRFLGCSE